MLYVDCTEYGMFVTIYGGPHGFQELVLPLCLCKQLREPGEESYINLALFQAAYIKPTSTVSSCLYQTNQRIRAPGWLV